MTRAILVTGAGGVGKTTVSAALAVAAARRGLTTLVLTVDPARRLADALGADHLGHEPTEVDGAPKLHAAMLDATASWESIVERYAPPDAASRLLDDPFFRAIADRFPAAQAFAAGETMAQHLESRRFDLLVVDTPPSAGGIDFFLAPRNMRELVGGRVLRWLTGARLPARRTLYKITARPMLRIADAVLGGPLLEDLAEFLLDLRTIYDGLRDRARVVERHLRSAITLVVTTADPSPLREARRFFDALPDVAGPPSAVLFNRALPDAWADLTRIPPPDGGIDPPHRAVLSENLRRWAAEARRQRDARAEFAGRHDTVPATLPWLPSSPTTLAELAALAAAGEGLPIDRLGFDPTD